MATFPTLAAAVPVGEEEGPMRRASTTAGLFNLIEEKCCEERPEMAYLVVYSDVKRLRIRI
jgi:hypothetical protein